jgi:hypothetical protein
VVFDKNLGHGFLGAGETLYFLGPDEPVALATLPAGWEPVGLGFPYAASATHVTYGGERLTVTRADGSIVAHYSPSSAPDDPWDIYPMACSATQGIASARQRNGSGSSLQAYKLEGASLTMKELAAGGEVVQRPDSCTFVIVTPGKTIVYDVATGQELEYEALPGQTYWATYPAPSAYRP